MRKLFLAAIISVIPTLALADTIRVDIELNKPEAVANLGFLDGKGNVLGATKDFRIEGKRVKAEIDKSRLTGMRKFCVLLKSGYHFKDRRGKKYPASCDAHHGRGDVRKRYTVFNGPFK